MTVYLLYYDTDTGAREEWNVFYTPCEIFYSPEKRQERIEFMKSLVDKHGAPMNYEFHTQDLEIVPDGNIKNSN